MAPSCGQVLDFSDDGLVKSYFTTHNFNVQSRRLKSCRRLFKVRNVGQDHQR